MKVAGNLNGWSLAASSRSCNDRQILHCQPATLKSCQALELQPIWPIMHAEVRTSEHSLRKSIPSFRTQELKHTRRLACQLVSWNKKQTEPELNTSSYVLRAPLQCLTGLPCASPLPRPWNVVACSLHCTLHPWQPSQPSAEPDAPVENNHKKSAPFMTQRQCTWFEGSLQ